MYESTEEIMRPSAAMDTLIAKYTREDFRDPADLLYDGFDIYAEVNDIAGVENFYQWDWIHYRRAVQCNKVFDRSQNAEVYIPCFPHDCWDITYNDRVIIQTDQLREVKPWFNL
jgi:hypothetical protein